MPEGWRANGIKADSGLLLVNLIDSASNYLLAKLVMFKVNEQDSVMVLHIRIRDGTALS